MRIKPLSNRTITKSNRTLVEELTSIEKRSIEIEDEMLYIIENLDYKDIIPLMDELGGKVSKIDKDSPCFVNRYGEVISVGEATGDDMHFGYMQSLLSLLFDKYGFSKNDTDREACTEYIDREDLIEYLFERMVNLGIYRINTGTNGVERRFYCVLPDKEIGRAHV